MTRYFGLSFAILMLFFVFAGNVGADNLSFIHTANLGDVYSGVTDDPLAPTPTEVRTTLLSLKQRYPNSVFIDSGNFHGPRAMHESNFAIPPLKLFKEVDSRALHFGSRDMLFSHSRLGIFSKETPLNLPVLSTVETKGFPKHIKFEKSRRFKHKKREILVSAIAEHERVAPNLTSFRSKFSNKNSVEHLKKVFSENTKADLNIVLSDRHPRENDLLAKSLPANTLVFEQSVYGVNPEDQPKQVRKVGDVWIVNKVDWWAVDKVDLEFDPTGAIGKIKISKHLFNPWFKQPEIPAWKFWAKRPPPPSKNREAVIGKPAINIRMQSWATLAKVGIPLDEVQEFRSRNSPGLSERSNKNTYFYHLIKNDEVKMVMIEIGHDIFGAFASISMQIGLDTETGEIIYWRPMDVVRLWLMYSDINGKYMPAFEGKSIDEIYLAPEDIYGLEYHADYLIKNIHNALKVYQKTKSKSKLVEDIWDMEDVMR